MAHLRLRRKSDAGQSRASKLIEFQFIKAYVWALYFNLMQHTTIGGDQMAEALDKLPYHFGAALERGGGPHNSLKQQDTQKYFFLKN